MSLVSFFLAVVVFIFVVMRSSVKRLCGLCWARVECDRHCPATWSLRCSIRCTFFCLGLFQRKDSWRERCTQHARRRKSCQRIGVRRQVKRCSERRLSQLSFCCHSASFRKCAQLPRLLLVLRLDDVRKCLLTRSGEEQANNITHDQHLMCLWPKLRIRVSQICVVVP